MITKARAIFYVSDGTGVTAETIGHSVLTQFDGIPFQTRRLPFVDNEARARAAAAEIRRFGDDTGYRPVVINTVVDGHLSSLIAESGALMLDVFAPFIPPMEQELGVPRTPKVGKAHGGADSAEYEARMNATNYALTHDDGVQSNFSDAEVILMGVSRSGKTPTCLYMALHYGVRAANYPLLPEDLENGELPPKLRPHRERIYGLTIDPHRLAQIREQRRAGSRYASIDQCRWEVEESERFFKRESIPVMHSTHMSIEEIASKIMQSLGMNRQLY
ncbi:MAG: pyruvate, water dikinase regulatory protein [Lysobacterales bacterium]|nr:kinase/pyrophosphorylase [Xanthomonadales bacterium]MCB1610213.1 kinase/pyrophosphorylase [Xanthomonadales bacterium]MCP5475053.1 kinase/pyrophosphorylase [Rhodanobacteraceae bacterium]